MQRVSPMPDEDSRNVIKLYHKHAELWDELRGRTLIERHWLDRFLDTIPLPAPDILDIGCGSGEPIDRYLIGRGCQITGIDGAVALVERAKTSFPEHTWMNVDMRRLPSLQRYHGIIAWHSFFHLTPEEQRPMFEVFDRLSVSGAALLFTSGTTHDESFGSFAGQPLYHGSLDSSEYRDLLHANGFSVVQHAENDPNCGGATAWLARKVR